MKTLGVMVLGIVVLGCGPNDAPVLGQSPSGRPTSTGLTVAQCTFFDADGKVRICHATGSAKHPYNVLQVSDAGCVEHSAHPNDYVPTSGDSECRGGGCFPLGAPADPKIPCCPGLVSRDGVCADPCAGVTCAAQDQCHSAGACDPGTGQCSHPAMPDQTACDDGNASTCGDVCTAGACAGAVIDLQTDLANCGACGNVCPDVANGTAACTAGACGVAACSPGYTLSNGHCVPAAPAVPASCRLVNGILWCYDPNACGKACNDVCSSLGLSITISNADWFAAQNTAAKCQAISDAFGLGGTVTVGDFGFACIEDWQGNHAAPGGLLPPLLCSINPGCPRLHRTLVDQLGVACGPSSRRAVCPCQ